MPVVVHPYETFADLLNGLGNPVRRDTPARQPVVVPSLAFADQLERRMADRYGFSMGLEWFTPQQFIHRAVGPGEGSPWSKRMLVWRVLPHVGNFAKDLGVEAPSPRDRFALSVMLADRFDQYGHYRPEMIARWASGGAAPTAQEAWQRDLWRRLRAETEHPHPAEELMRLRENAAARAAFAGRRRRLFVVATGMIDPLLVALLGLLGEAGADVEVHVLLPSLGYLGDLQRRGALPREESDPEMISTGSGHPLVESMGRNAVGAFVLLGQLDDQYSHWPEPAENPEADLAAPALVRLRDDIRALRTPTDGAGKNSLVDASVRVHSCFGPRREMEVLRDELWRAFRDLPGLQPDEIHIVTPDLETYAPLVPAVFGNGDQSLPVRLTERAAVGGEAGIEVFGALLDMVVSGRFEAAEVMELLQKEIVLEALGAEDAESVRAWVRDSGLTHGLAAGDPEGMESPRPGTSTFARDRLVAGRWFGVESMARYPDGDYVLPVGDSLGGDHHLAMRLHDWLLALERTLMEWSGTAPAKAWAERLATAGETLFGADEDTRLRMREPIEFLREVDCAEPVDAASLRDWLSMEWEESRHRAGVSGKIAFGRMKQLQNLPCRVLAVVGMRGTAFPAQNRAPVWDLLRAGPRVWDRNPRVDDRQTFLDAILTPSDRIIITAANRNPRTGKGEPFSACVDELSRTLLQMGLSPPVVNHRLQPFAADYFHGGNDRVRSFDGHHAAVAAKIHNAGTRGGQIFSPEIGPPEFVLPGLPNPTEGLETITADQLAGFWKDPAAGFLRALGVTLPRDEPTDAEYNRPALALDGLRRWIMHDEILRCRMDPFRPDKHLAQRLRADRGLPPGHLGDIVWASGIQATEPLARAVRRVIGDEDEIEHKLTEEVRVMAKVHWTRAKDHLVFHRVGGMKQPRHYLEPWMTALVAGACGKAAPILFFDEANADHPLQLPPVPADEARGLLDILVRGWFAARHQPLRFAPAASDCIARKLRSGDSAGAILAGAAEWNREDSGYGGGEGTGAAARLVWRDADPFDRAGEWIYWAETIAVPLLEWGGAR